MQNDVLQHSTIYAYQAYLLNVGGEDERKAQRNLRYCDGSMQKYLEASFRREPSSVREIVLARQEAPTEAFSERLEIKSSKQDIP